MPRPPTGKTPLRNLRSPDEVWLPALARTVAEHTTVTDVVNTGLREYGRTPPTRRFTFSEWPEAAPWLDANYAAWRDCAAALGAAVAGLAGEEYLGVAMWLAITRYPADRKQQRRVIAGFLLGRALTITAGGWREKYNNTRTLLQAVNQVLNEQLPPAAGTARRNRRVLRPESQVR